MPEHPVVSALRTGPQSVRVKLPADFRARLLGDLLDHFRVLDVLEKDRLYVLRLDRIDEVRDFFDEVGSSSVVTPSIG